MNPMSPRHHPAHRALLGVGMPDDRQARLAARHALLELKQTYLVAIETLPGPRAEWLRFQVRHATEPADLWRLRAAVFDALPQHNGHSERDALQRSIDSVFPQQHTHRGLSPQF